MPRKDIDVIQSDFDAMVLEMVMIHYKMHNENARKAAKNLGVTHSTYWKWVNGVNKPSSEYIPVIMDAVGATIVIGGEDLRARMDAGREAPEALVLKEENERLKNMLKAQDTLIERQDRMLKLLDGTAESAPSREERGIAPEPVENSQ